VRTDSGVVAGALALIINPDREFTRMLSVARSGESGETYAFDQHGLLLSRSRFDDQLRELGLLDPTNTSSALNLRLHDPGGDLSKGYKPASDESASRELTRIVAAAVAGQDGVDAQPSRDYRGINVVGAWRWLPEHGFGVATQIDAAEAYKPLRVLQVVFVLLFLLLVLCACIMFLFSYRDVVWRQRLDEAELKLKRLGQYTLEQKIGEGGMGVVYRARHALMRRETAIKLLLPDRADPASIERFEREVCLTCQLSHPNTIQIYDYGHTPDGIFYYVMELLRGLNLHELVTRCGPQPEGRVIHILTQVCESLAEAHALGLIHRDIKPANVYLCERGGVPDCVKVLDFGLVRLYRAEKGSPMHLTGEKGIVGTPWFMSPESIKNSALSDPRSDIYAIGALAYFLLTREYVFNGESVMEVYEKQLTQAPPPPGRRSSNPVSPELERTILRCLEKDPQLRPQTISELRALLQASPRTTDWGPQQRASWWNLNQPQAAAPTGPPSPVPATISIELRPRNGS
jgi:serine/threonine protein kinase